MLLKPPFRLLIGLFNNLQVVNIINYNTVTGLHNLQILSTNLFTLSSVVFTYSQYNMGAIPVSLYYTLPIPSHTITSNHTFWYSSFCVHESLATTELGNCSNSTVFGGCYILTDSGGYAILL